jgi:anaerobic selenocysteine-containing dehydrogenase
MFSRSIETQKKKTLDGTRDLIDSGSTVNIYLSYKTNPVFDESDNQTVKQFFNDETKVNFLAVLDTHMTETAMLADLVLPAATYLESWGLEYVPSLPVLNLRQPVVSLQGPAKILRSPDFEVGKVIEPSFLPRGEAKEVGNVCIEWARRIGGKVRTGFSTKNTLEFYSQKIKQMPDTEVFGGFKSLKNTGFWIEGSGVQSLKTPPEKTDLDKINIKTIPGYQTDDSKTTKTNSDFFLTTYRTGFFANETMNSKWLREIAHDNPLWINRSAAKDLGIQNGDLLRISSENASLITRALVTDRIHPESVALAQGFGHTATGRIAKAEKFKSSDGDTSLLWWEKEGKGINPNELIVGHRDPISGVFSTKNTPVKIEKI